MADPKYANLPGLAPDDEPDVYETDDRPEAEQELDYEDESENVERLHISATEAYNKFKDKHLDGQRADFSDRLRKTRHTGYDARSGEWELAGEGEQETVIQKFNRLKCEIQQLSEDVAGLKSSLREDASEGQRASAQLGPEVERLQRHLCDVNLEQLLGAELITSLGDPQAALKSKLETQLSQLAGGGASAAAGTPAGSGPSGAATYELHLRPERARAQQAAALGQLEKRLERMEKAVGATPDKMSRLSAETRQRSVLSAVAALSSKVALLDPATLEAAEGRLQALHQRMNQLAELKQANADPEKHGKVSELYDLLKGTEAFQGELPSVLDRLNALQALHDQALNFSRRLSQLETGQQKIETCLTQGETQLESVQQDCAKNLAAFQQGLDALTKRLDTVRK